MQVIQARNVNEAYETASSMLECPAAHGMFRAESRNGPTWEMPHPVTTIYRAPEECVLWNGKRDCNPFFHFFESLWMLSGQNDVAYLDQFNSKMKQYSDDGETFHGAYGHRWRHYRSIKNDQFHDLIAELNNPTTRRAVLGMWDAEIDLLDAPMGAKDLPCNLCVVFSRRHKADELDMTVYNRSNDIIYGAYGANAVHFSFLLQWVAAAVGCKVGTYYQVSNNWHAYESVMQEKLGGVCSDFYKAGTVCPSVMVHDNENAWDVLIEIERFVNSQKSYGKSEFIDTIANPMYCSWQMWKRKNKLAAVYTINQAMHKNPQNDWLKACELWMKRRLA